MNQADLDKARAEVDPEERAFRDLMALGRQYLGIILLAEKLGETATLRGVTEKAKADADQAQARLADLNAAYERADRETYGAVAKWETDRKERERILASMDQQIEGARAQATEIVAAAERQSANAIDGANLRHFSIIEDAEAMAVAIKENADREFRAIIAAAQDQAAEAKHAASGYQATLRDMEKAATKAEERLKAARAAIAKMAAEE
jgi:hypothetical protein